jgi:hypothetical protein
VRPRTTLPVGRPQNTRARQARVTAPVRRARLLAPTQTPTGLVRRPACSALPCSQAIAPARPWRVRTAVTDPPVRNAPAATTSASIRMVRSPRRMNRTMVS